MKKFLFLFLVISFPFSSIFAAGAMGVSTVTDPTLIATTIKENVETAVRYAQQLKEWSATAQHMMKEVEQWKFQFDSYLQTIKSAKDIKSWDDFMNWSNRTLSMTRNAEDSVNKATIKIGGKEYSLRDLEGIVDAVDDRYIQYWNKEFSEEERKSMWLQLGLTPANYAYVKTFSEKQRKMSEEAFFASDIQNEWYTRNMERNNERQERLAQDKNIAMDSPNKMGEVELLQLMLESSMESNKVLNDIAMNQAYQMEMQATEYYLNQLDYDAPVLSDWSKGGFQPLEYDTKH